MPLTPGLGSSIRLAPPTEPELSPPSDLNVPPDQDGGDVLHFDDSGAVLKIEHEDGSVTVSLDGKPIDEPREKQNAGWFGNLIEDLDDMEEGRIAEDLMRGIGDDIISRSEWIEDRASGIKLLGLKIEVPGLSGSSEGAPVDGMSKVRHPLLMEAVLRFQANARSELLPTDGPVKIRNDNNDATVQNDHLANILEKDLNHYLTAVATEYYPDTDRMLLLLGFGGTAFKKVYFCPLRNRPVSETVDADDLIVNNAATDLGNAKRITHRTLMRPSTVKRLQILGVYRDVDLQTPNQANLDSVQLEKRSQEGIAPSTSNPEDRDREIYECYCELDIKGFEHKWKGKETGLEIPYVATIDVTSKKILSLVRNYEEPKPDDDNQLPEPRQKFVKYTFVPGFGFYDIGLLNILGNTTNAITAAWREMLDSGMFANFPGFLISKMGSRQNTNIFRIPPGGGAQVETNGQSIRDAIMPLPYSAQGLPALGALVDNMAQTGMRVGGTSEQQVGEGRADAPVGTTLALIEQAQKILNAVHKRMHAAQAQEFQLLAKCFKDHPDSFLRQRKMASRHCWNEQEFRQALEDCNLVPQADPNTASHTQRIMKVMGLKQLQAAQPSLYDPIAIDMVALQALGWSNPQQFMAPPSAQASPPPQLLQAQAESQSKMITANARMLDAQTKAKQAMAPAPGLGAATVSKGPSDDELQIKAMEAETKAKQLEVTARNNELDAHSQNADREKDLAIQRAKIIVEEMRSRDDRVHDHGMQDKALAAQHISSAIAASKSIAPRKGYPNA